MKTEEMKDKALHEIFRRMETSVLPENFNDRIMKRVYREKSRQEWRNFILVTFTCVVMLALAVYVFVHYFSFPLPAMFGTLLEKAGNDIFSGLRFYGFILLPVGFLLWLDYWLRRRSDLKNFRSEKS